MRSFVLLVGLLAAPAAAVGKEITLGEKEQITIGQICEIAARAPNIQMEVTAGIANWCVQWGKRVNEQAVPATTAPATKTDENK